MKPDPIVAADVKNGLKQVAAPEPAKDPKKTDSRVVVDPYSTVTYINSSGIGVQTKGRCRYRLDRILGEGAFGQVYLGFDTELQRQPVFISVPSAFSQRLYSAITCCDSAPTDPVPVEPKFGNYSQSPEADK